MRRRKFNAGLGAATGAVLLSSTASPFPVTAGMTIIDDEPVFDKTINSVPQIIIHSGKPDTVDHLNALSSIGWKAIAGGQKYGNFETLEARPDEMSVAELQGAVNKMLNNAGSAMRKVWTGVPISYEDAMKKLDEYTESLYEQPKRLVEVPNKPGWYRHALKRDRGRI